MTERGFCVVAPLSSHTSGRPLTRSARIGKSRFTACGSNTPGERAGTSTGVTSTGVVESVELGSAAGTLAGDGAGGTSGEVTAGLGALGAAVCVSGATGAAPGKPERPKK